MSGGHSKSVDAGLRKIGKGRGPWAGKFKTGGQTPDQATGKNIYGYDGEHSRGKKHDWAPGNASQPTSAMPVVTVRSKYTHAMGEAGSGASNFRGTKVKGVLRVSGHKGAHLLGGRSKRGLFGK